MPRNKTGGKGHKHAKNQAPKMIVYSDGPDQLYGQIIGAKGSGHFGVKCTDGKERLCRMRGALYKRKWAVRDSYVLVSIRSDDTEDNRGDIIEVYEPEQVGQLFRKGEMGELGSHGPDQDTGFVFRDQKAETIEPDEPDEPDEPVKVRSGVPPLKSDDDEESDPDIYFI